MHLNRPSTTTASSAQFGFNLGTPGSLVVLKEPTNQLSGEQILHDQSSLTAEHPSSSSTNASLLLGLKDNDAHSWEQFVELYAELIFNWCRISQLNSADAADVMQEVFAAVSLSIARFKRKPNGTLRGWLWQITQNKIRDHYRAKPHAKADGGTAALDRLNEIPAVIAESNELDLLISHNVSESSATATSLRKESDRLLRRAMKQIRSEFSERSWSAFWRNVVEGQKTRFVAEDLGISAAGVRQAKRRILRRLRQQLGDAD